MKWHILYVIDKYLNVYWFFSHGLLRKAWIVPPLGVIDLCIYLFDYLFSSLTFLVNATPPRVVGRF